MIVEALLGWLMAGVSTLIGWVLTLIPIPGVPEWISGLPAFLGPTLATMGHLCSWVPFPLGGTVVAAVVVVWFGCLFARVLITVSGIVTEWLPL
ncbi:MAG: hypothetical protein QM804_15650 [Propionicimonas sp.]